MANHKSYESEFPDSAWKQRLRRRLLRWFDVHAREMPWRPSPGLYETWVSEIMLQQTHDVMCQHGPNRLFDLDGTDIIRLVILSVEPAKKD